MDYTAIIVSVLLILVIYLLYYNSKCKVSKFSNADIEKSQRLFEEAGGKLTFSAFKTHMDDADIVDYTDMKNMYYKT